MTTVYLHSVAVLMSYLSSSIFSISGSLSLLWNIRLVSHYPDLLSRPIEGVNLTALLAELDNQVKASQLYLEEEKWLDVPQAPYRSVDNQPKARPLIFAWSL